MQGLDVTEIFDEPLALAPIHSVTEAYMPKPRSHDPRTQVRGTLAFPLTHQVAENLVTHGEEWTRQFYLERGVSRFELDILIVGARKAVS